MKSWRDLLEKVRNLEIKNTIEALRNLSSEFTSRLNRNEEKIDILGYKINLMKTEIYREKRSDKKTSK